MLLQKNALIRIDRSSFNSYILTPKYIHFLKRWNPKTTLTICQAKREGDGEETYGCPNIYIYIYIKTQHSTPTVKQTGCCILALTIFCLKVLENFMRIL